MKVRHVLSQIEKLFGRQPEKYVMQLMNDGLMDIANEKGSYLVSSTTDLYYKKRWYQLNASVLSIEKVEVLDTDNRYVMIPKLTDPHRLLRGDTDSDNESLT